MKKFLIIMSLIMVLLTGCGEKKTKIVLHTGFMKNEVFRVEQMSCTLPELMYRRTLPLKEYPMPMRL